MLQSFRFFRLHPAVVLPPGFRHRLKVAYLNCNDCITCSIVLREASIVFASRSLTSIRSGVCRFFPHLLIANSLAHRESPCSSRLDSSHGRPDPLPGSILPLSSRLNRAVVRVQFSPITKKEPFSSNGKTVPACSLVHLVSGSNGWAFLAGNRQESRCSKPPISQLFFGDDSIHRPSNRGFQGPKLRATQVPEPCHSRH